MKKYQLYRPLLYQDRRSIDEFIKEDPMWEELYRLYLQMEKKQYRDHMEKLMKTIELDTFNTLRFFCVCIMMDSHWDEDFKGNYIRELETTPGVKTDVCLSLAYVVFKLMKNPPSNIGRLLHELESPLKSKLDLCKKEFVLASIYLEQKEYKWKTWQIDLCPGAVKPASLPHSEEWWKMATNFFTQDDLYVMLNFWPDPDDKLAVLDRMQEAGAMKADCLEIHTRLMELKKTNAVHPFGENLTLFASDILNIWNECQRVWEHYGLLQAPETTSTPLPDEEKAQLEKTLTATALEVKRLLKENQALDAAKKQLESQNKALQAELEALRTKNSKPAAGTPSEPEELASLVDKALELGDENSLEKLLIWLTTKKGAERAQAQAKRVEQRLKELKAPVPHTQYNYYEGANHISGNQIKGVSIGTTPANRTLTQE